MKDYNQAQSRIKETVYAYLSKNHRNTHVPMDVMMNPKMGSKRN